MASKRRKPETAEATLERWIAGSVRGLTMHDLYDLGWEAGQEGYITVGDANYERFDVPSGYVVVEWTEDGSVGVC